ncbi:MAG: sigma-70 family RNA polymerase sigma factor [Crocinitomicaceae bacterium]|nr:sigma-70 family RNA polymerase sigma factor [Crocinitomicaceae bacterium]
MITKEIVIGFSKGEKAAFDKIYAAFSASMFGVCLRYARCRDDAKDMLQESFIKLYNSRESINIDMPIAPWLKTITIRTALNYIKKNYSNILVENELKFDKAIMDVEDEVDKQELMEKLIKILQQLPDGYRTVFNLYTIDNLTHKEIADYLSISEGTSKSQYFKAKKMIQELLAVEKQLL